MDNTRGCCLVCWVVLVGGLPVPMRLEPDMSSVVCKFIDRIPISMSGSHEALWEALKWGWERRAFKVLCG
eukprot:10266553-Lingulodinium_polyedra.AAC.1